ncbi:ribonuclease H-like domain-containing protein [Tepidibacter formicigenes]|jgi:uncharacterized protein YprB with RNaseH-like and TPR domain|uniref:YprB ribonuclease H-like domain-containing protein n=1 Tax=Tepidibacter formicigenes DSM 15518 TaxID=1123349 RepID=A0A1M6NMW9_9FIRM|nr:ribonuclease H-like domain-containing protein [Tepidibacter formicigenes]SHJ97097.1 hypothetical protein SAMN02744037_01309 [Tepidibacter formicigenes DSM 15518]
MDIITHKLDEVINIPNNYCVFDIETTGLSPKYSKVILIGILYIKNNQTIIQQFFAENTNEEKEILFYFKEVFKTFENHITFNGHRFDIPFLNQRFKKNNLDFSIDKNKDIDILKIVKPYQKKLGLENCKLKTVEKLIGIERKDTINGKESVELYKKFELNRSENLKKKILLHNYEDIYYLGKLFKIKDIIDSKEEFIEINFMDNISKLKLSSYKFIKDNFNLEYESNDIIPINIEIYKDNYTIMGNDRKVNIILNTMKGIDKSGNNIIYFEHDKIIPLKIGQLLIEENIKSLGEYLLKKGF